MRLPFSVTPFNNRVCQATFPRPCRHVLLLTLLAAQLCSVAQPVRAQAAKEDAAKAKSASADDKDKLPAHYIEFADRLTGATLVGHFTIPGLDLEKPLHEERYEIRRVTKIMGNGDYWLFLARIKYGDHDITVPMPLEVKWAGKTAVITLDHVTIPKLGTFDARVVIDGTRYAGTWQHNDVGGHLFGSIEKPAQDATADKDAAADKDVGK